MAAIAVAGLSVAFAAAQTGPAGLVFFGNNAIKESMNSSAPIAQLVGGQGHAVALRVDGTVTCWGYDRFHQCDVPSGIINAVQVAAGDNHTIVLRADGTIAQFGDDTYDETFVPSSLGPFKLIAAGANMTLVEQTNGTVWAYGEGASNEAQQIPSFKNAVALAVGDNGEAIAMDSSGNVTGWGTTVPAGIGQCKAITAGGGNFGVIQAAGTMQLWGGGYGGSSNNVPPPTNLQNIVQLSVGRLSGVAIQSNGTVSVWGSPSFGLTTGAKPNLVQVCACYQSILGIQSGGIPTGWGDPGNGKITMPTNMYGLNTVVAGYSHVSFLKNDGTLFAWGDNSKGQCNYPTTGGFTTITAGEYHTAAWGPGLSAGAGLFGDNSWGQVTVPSGLPTIDKLWAAGNTTYVHGSSGGLQSWGINGDNELTLKATLNNALSITGAHANAYAIDLSGNFHGVGQNGSMQLDPPGGIGVLTQVASMNQHVIALNNAGVASLWGDNSYGQKSNAPAGALTGVQQVAAGYEHNVVLKTNGNVLAWGGTESGQAPAPAGLTGMAEVAAGGYFTVCMPKLAMSLAPYSVVQGQSGTGTIYLPHPAPAGGTIVTLQANNSAATINAGVSTLTVPAGKYYATFDVHGNGVTAATPVVVTATFGNYSQQSLVTIVPPAFTISTNVPFVIGGSTDKLTGNIVLAKPAPTGGVNVLISSSDPTMTPSVTSVHINGGATQPATPFTISTSVVNANKTDSLIGQYAGQTLSTNVQLQPFKVISFVFNPTSFIGGGKAFAIVNLNDTPVSPLSMTFTSNDIIAFPSPGSQWISSASQDLYFPTNYVGTNTPVTITGTYNGVSTTANATVLKAVQSMQFSSAPWYGACSSFCTITLTAPAPSPGLTFNMQGDGNCTSPFAQITIPTGATSSGQFQVYGSDVSASTTATLYATLGVINFTGQGTILPNTVSALAISPSSSFSVSGHPGTGSLDVTILGSPDYDVTVNLQSSNTTYASFTNSTLTIPKGSTSANASFSHIAHLMSAVTVTLTATRAGKSKTITLTLTP